MTNINRYHTEWKTPKVFNADNPVQAEGAARGKEWRTVLHNPVGVEHFFCLGCAPTEHRDRGWHRHTPSCASLARGYQKFASYGGVRYPILSSTVALDYCLDFSVTIGATAAMNTIYGSYSTQSGFSVGWVAGMTSYAGFPLSTNLATVGVNYNITNRLLSVNFSAFYWQPGQKGFSFNPSFSVAVLPQEFTNLVRRQGFRDNDQVLKRFVANGQQQKALGYFGFKGTYDPNNALFEKWGTDPGITDPKTGEIFYSDGAFAKNYDYLALIAHHESIHSQSVLSGKFDGNYGLDDWHAYMTNYRNQGLYPNYGNDLVGRINDSGWQGGIYGTFTGSTTSYTVPPFSPAWWHFIYRIPRVW